MPNSVLHPHSRISVVGTSGSGKSTYARKLAEKLNLTDIELDALFWEPNWTQADPTIFRQRIEQAMNEKPGWVVHGNYRKHLDLTIGQADVLIWLDYSRTLVMWRVFKRSVLRILSREPLWSGNRESFRKTFLSKESIILWAWQTFTPRRQQYTELVRRPEFAHLRVLHWTHPRQAEHFFKEL